MKARRLPAGGIGRPCVTLLVAGSLALVATAAAARVVAVQAPVVALAVAGSDHALFKVEPHALYRSADEGRHWQSVNLPKAAADGAMASIAVAAHGDDVIYIAGPGLGVWRSADRGRSWVSRNAGLPSTDVQTLTTHADQADTVYAYVSAKGIYRSDDAGHHWRLMDAGPRAPIVGFVHTNMPGSMQTGWLFAATGSGVSRSMDCFCGWRDAGALKSAVTAVAYDPSEPKRVYAITAKAVAVSEDGGEQWSQRAAPGAGIVALAVDERGIAYAIDGEGALLRSTDQGRLWLRADD